MIDWEELKGAWDEYSRKERWVAEELNSEVTWSDVTDFLEYAAARAKRKKPREITWFDICLDEEDFDE